MKKLGLLIALLAVLSGCSGSPSSDIRTRPGSDGADEVEVDSGGGAGAGMAGAGGAGGSGSAGAGGAGGATVLPDSGAPTADATSDSTGNDTSDSAAPDGGAVVDTGIDSRPAVDAGPDSAPDAVPVQPEAGKDSGSDAGSAIDAWPDVVPVDDAGGDAVAPPPPPPPPPPPTCASANYFQVDVGGKYAREVGTQRLWWRAVFTTNDGTDTESICGALPHPGGGAPAEYRWATASRKDLSRACGTVDPRCGLRLDQAAFPGVSARYFIGYGDGCIDMRTAQCTGNAYCLSVAPPPYAFMCVFRLDGGS